MNYPFLAILFVHIPPLTIKTVTHTILSHIVRCVARSLCDDTANQPYGTLK